MSNKDARMFNKSGDTSLTSHQCHVDFNTFFGRCLFVDSCLNDLCALQWEWFDMNLRGISRNSIETAFYCNTNVFIFQRKNMEINISKIQHVSTEIIWMVDKMGKSYWLTSGSHIYWQWKYQHIMMENPNTHQQIWWVPFWKTYPRATLRTGNLS